MSRNLDWDTLGAVMMHCKLQHDKHQATYQETHSICEARMCDAYYEMWQWCWHKRGEDNGR